MLPILFYLNILETETILQLWAEYSRRAWQFEDCTTFKERYEGWWIFLSLRLQEARATFEDKRDRCTELCLKIFTLSSDREFDYSEQKWRNGRSNNVKVWCTEWKRSAFDLPEIIGWHLRYPFLVTQLLLLEIQLKINRPRVINRRTHSFFLAR